MNSGLANVGLPLAIAIVMLGLGLALTVADFVRVTKHPRAVAVALTCQVLLLPAAAFGFVLLFDLPPVLAVGMMLLAASPGGTTANLYSHLFRGDVALNVSLTAINSILAVITLPLVTNFAIDWFEPSGGAGDVGLQFGKTVQVFALVLVPVAVGMVIRHVAPDFATTMDRKVRIVSVLVLVTVVLGAIIAERDNITTYVADVGAITALFCLTSLCVGYLIPRAVAVSDRQAIACSMEVGIHNATLAIAVAAGVRDNVEMAVPAAVYGVVMFPLAAGFGWLISRRLRRSGAVPAAPATTTAPERRRR